MTKYVSGEDVGPLVVDLDPTTACNFTCPECVSAGLLNKKKFESARLKKLIEELHASGVLGIVFIGGGEPLAHKSMPLPLVRAHELGMDVGLTTNGSLIKRYEQAIAESVSWTRVSMDAGTSRTFDIFRPNLIPNCFSKILSAMESLSKIKTGALGYSYVILRRDLGVDNISELYEAARLAKEVGCDYFEYKPMFDMEHFLIPFDDAQVGQIHEQHERMKELEDGHFQVVAPASMQLLLNGDGMKQPKRYTSCPAMKLRTTITPDGVYPCAYHRGREDLRLGDIDDTDFGSFWNSRARRDASAHVNPTEHCEFFCARNNSNLVLNALEELSRHGVSLIDYIDSYEVDDVFI